MAKTPVSDIDKKVGKRIQQCRKERGLTVVQLSEKIELAAQTISRYERGENKINLEHLTLIAIELQTPISWFLIDEEQSYTVKISKKVVEKKETYIYSNPEDLERRLLQRWQNLTIEQKRALIILIDTM
ncbi:transcriptional regulator [Gilliamella apicola]|uniref:Transcriptional regulator n=1 Tax=Gilliamella apicola TaxID=1196095 RepID=A0A2V4DZZ9_9GAMM|nr:helix-turn-helix transcriptional regulator [Gilliamella apicola]PXZ06512.1 transcriptional regulator [Gilliamella apicola]